MTAHRVLVVEDEEDNMNLFVQILNYHGCEALQACDGREAITIAQQELPDLILMDLSLPALDGWEATKAIKDIPELVGIPVVALTAHIPRSLPILRRKGDPVRSPSYQRPRPTQCSGHRPLDRLEHLCYPKRRPRKPYLTMLRRRTAQRAAGTTAPFGHDPDSRTPHSI